MKYTAKDIREQKISFKDLTGEEYNRIYKHFKKLYPEDYKNPTFGLKISPKKYHSFYHKTNGDKKFRCAWSELSFTNAYWYVDCENTNVASKEITFSEFDFEEIAHIIGRVGYKDWMDIFSIPDTITHSSILKVSKLKQKEMDYQIPIKDFLKLIDAACNTWKTKLNKHLTDNLNVETGLIVVKQKDLNLMLIAATTHNGVDQKKVIEEVFSIGDDPYKVFKDALKEGKEVQIYSMEGGTWVTQKTYAFIDDPENYRIKHKHQDLIDLWEKDKTQVVQFKDDGKTWFNCKNPLWSEDLEYRIKPKEEYVPFDFSDAKELIGERVSVYGGFRVITRVFNGGVELGDMTLTFKHLFDKATFLYGSKCGKLKS